MDKPTLLERIQGAYTDFYMWVVSQHFGTQVAVQAGLVALVTIFAGGSFLGALATGVLSAVYSWYVFA